MAIKYTDLFASDVHYGLLELEDDAKRLDQTFAELAKVIGNSKSRISVTIKQQNTELKETKTALEALDVATEGSVNSLLKMVKAYDETSKKTRDLKNHQESLNSIFDLSTASVDEIKTRIKQLTTEYNALGRATDADKSKMKALSGEVSKLKTEQDGLTKVLAKGTRAIDVAENSYQQASNELARLRKELRELPNAIDMTTGKWDKSNIKVAEHLKQIQKLDTSLKKFDSDMGNHQRNVGNYASGWNGLGNSINRITQELPAFTMSMQTGFLAISNNLPILFEEIGKTKTEIAALRAEGQKVPGLFSKLTSSIFSWWTVLNLGVAVLTLFGPKLVDWVSSLFDGKKAVDNLKMSQEALNKSFESSELVDATKNVFELKTNIELAKKGFIDKKVAVDDYNETLGKTIGTAKDFNELESIMVDKTPAYLEMMKLRAAAQLALNDAAKKTLEAQQEQARSDAQTSGTDFQGNGYLRSGLQNSEGGKKLAEKIKNDRIKGMKDEADAELDIFQKLQNQAAKIAKDNKFDLFGDEKTNKEKAEKVAEGFEIIRKKMSEVSLEMEKGLLDGTVDESDKILAKRYKDLESQLNKLIELQNSLLNPLPDFKAIQGIPGNPNDKINIAEPKADKNAGVDRETDNLQEVERRYAQHYAKLLKLYREGSITKQQYDAQDSQFEIDRIHEIYFVNQNIINERLKIVKKGSREELVLKKQQAELEMKLQQDVNKHFFEAQEAQKAIISDVISTLKDSSQLVASYLGQGVASLFDSLISDLERFNSATDWSTANFQDKFQAAAEIAMSAMQAFTEYSISASEQRIANLQIEKENDIAIAGDNEEAKKIIEDRYNQRVNAEKTKQARATKANAMFEIGINTAIAATKVTAQTGLFGLPLVPFIIGLGLAQLALVAAKPIPQYYKGTPYSKEGPAEVAERGPEMIEYPTGEKRIATKRQVTYLPKGSKVLTASQTKQMLERMSIDRHIEVNGTLSGNMINQKRNHDIETMAMALHMAKVDESLIGKAVGEQLAGIPINNWTVDENGFTKRIRRGNTTVNDLNNRNSLS